MTTARTDARTRPLAALVLAATALAAFAPAVRAADPEGIVEALKTVAGNPPKARASFAKGQCVRGSYAPAADAGQVTRSASLTRAWPVIGRFSVGGGNPMASDATKTVLRGFSIKILSEGGGTDLLFENAPVHFAQSLEQMLAFLKARAPGPDGKPDAAKIAAFTAANPETVRQAGFVAAKALPGSYAGVTYWGVHTFTGTNAAGAQVPFKFKVEPRAGEVTLGDEEAKGKPANFLALDLAERLAKGPVVFDVSALPARPGDPTMDITVRWPDEDARPGVRLGTVSVTALEPDATCDQAIFDPANLADGISPPKDELFQARQAAYAISFSRRLQ